jgi:GH15 family glucan-1,4-alpha-glucosidase
MTQTGALPTDPQAVPRDRYLPIADHGVIGDLHTVALVGVDGTIDWYCTPRFDSPSVFGSILDADRGGYWRVSPVDPCAVKQLYFPDTNVLITRFLAEEGVVEVTDFMPIARTPAEQHTHRLVRRVLGIRGEVRFKVEVEPRFDYGRAGHTTTVDDEGAVFDPDGSLPGLALFSRVPLERTEHGVCAEFTVAAGDAVSFVAQTLEPGDRPRYSERAVREQFKDTVVFWARWVSHSRYEGRWREMVNRSALTLKLLTYAPTGAIVAAPTTSLPEQVGGERNWDYRYTWIRDAAFTLYGLLRLGFTEEAGTFMEWLTARIQESKGSADGSPLQIMYGIDGRADLGEEELTHLEGYRGSAPVRIGNGAATQLQLDIYGELLDSVYLYNKHGRPLYHDTWVAISDLVDWVCDNWDRTDEGIWETRGGQKDFTYSRLMCWVAIERAIRIARFRGLPCDLPRWVVERDDVYRQIMDRGWNEKRKAFVQFYGSDVLDASVLLMPLTKFISPTDPRWLSTLDAITEELVSDSLVYRYNTKASPDGLRGDEGTFSICSFWYVEALTRAGRLEEAGLAFAKMLTYANHLGLYAEEIGPSGELLGNFPQAFTHLALISAAVNLDRALG